ncbi:MAG: ATP-binding protein [Nocardioides sp.]|uniref:ATP-binding protein n=1 Tax=Nocardioides sp. TaxID=35761 RepID=UPI003F0635E9
MPTLPLPIGHDLESGEPFTLDGSRFNRHTFWCGQSGSGKTYALGVVLEQLLVRTGLPLLVLDPNSDYVHLGRPHPQAPAAEAERLAACDVRVYSADGGTGTQPLRVRLVDMDMSARAAVLRLDPVADAGEYQALRELDSEYGPQDGAAMLASLATSDQPGRQALGRRIANLAVSQWDVWARGGSGIEKELDARPDAMVLDLGGFRHAEEPGAAALALLDRLWQRRALREPVLVVIDEAHNLCPAEPSTPLQRAVVDRLVQIAAEGRKYGLWLLLSTQRPSKIHPQVLSQCDNLALMRTNSPSDLDHVARFFGAVPRHLLDASPTSTLGQALFAGGFVAQPRRVQMGDRLTPEGGSDVPVPPVRNTTPLPKES